MSSEVHRHIEERLVKSKTLLNTKVVDFPKNKNNVIGGDVMGKKTQSLLDFKMADLKEIYTIFKDAFIKDPKSFTNPKFLYNYF